MRSNSIKGLALAAAVAVLACGVDRVYPSAHAELVRHVRDTAAVVSETPPGGTPQRIRFLARNRVIAALCTGTVVVEAAIRSGALNTANWTERLSRVLMGVPGPVTSAASQGVHGQQMLGEPLHALDVKVVGRLVEHDKVEVLD